jgi:uncharacterized protein (DUF1330 family)
MDLNRIVPVERLLSRRIEIVKANFKAALAMSVGMVIGVGGASAIYGRQAKAAPGYVISEVDAITDLHTLQQYGQKVGETIAPFNPHLLVSGGKIQMLDGEPPKGIVVIEFESAIRAREWYDSPAYQAIKGLRISSTKGRMFVVEGVTPK